MTFFGGRITEGRALTPTGSRDADMTEAGRLLDAYAARGRADGAPKLEDALSVLLSRSIRRLESRIARQPLPAPVTERVVSLRGARAFASTRLYLHLAHARHMVGAFSRDPAGGDISLYVYGANAQSHEAEFMFRHLQAAMYEFARTWSTRRTGTGSRAFGVTCVITQLGSAERSHGALGGSRLGS